MQYKAKLLTTLLVLSLSSVVYAGNGNSNNNNNANSGGTGGGQNIVNLNSCKRTDMVITGYRPVGTGSVIPFDAELGKATNCYGFYENANNSSHIMPLPTQNLGYAGDGWLNNKYSSLWPTNPGAFVTEAELQDLKTEGQFDDPGWVYLGKDDGSKFKGVTTSDGTNTYKFIDDLFTCSEDGVTYKTCANLTQGFWKYTPPATQPQELLDILGGDFFDSMAIIFKGGSGFAMYNFKLSAIGFDPILAGDSKFEFFGSFDLTKTQINNGGQSAGISNVSLWARDPFLSGQVSSPAVLALYGFGLVMLSLLMRRRRNA